MNFKIVSKRNPIVFLDVTSKFKNVESVNSDYLIVDVDTKELYHRVPKLEKTGEILPSLVVSELIYDEGIVRLKNEEELEVSENKKINDSYYGFAYKIEVFDFQAAISYRITDSEGYVRFPFNEYAQVILNTLVPKNAIVIKEDIFINPPTLQIRTKAFVYVNFLAIPLMSSMVTAQTLCDDNVTMVDIITTIEPNPVFELFNPVSVGDSIDIEIES